LKNVRTLKNESGFSLVELMVVVAIIGILASLAIPSVGKYMAKARQSEAKTQLASLYTAEKAFFAEYTSYDSRFGALGYSPEGKLRYNVGFTGIGVTAQPANGYIVPTTIPASFSLFATVGFCGANGVMNAVTGCAMLNGATNAAPPALPGAAVTGAGIFTAEAIAVVHQGVPTGDVWTIDNNKSLINTASGIP
jgi:type IV pilus assembly protein PilA